MSVPPGLKGNFLLGHTFSFHSNTHELILKSNAAYPASPVISLNVLGRKVGLVLDRNLAERVLAGESSLRSDSEGKRSGSATDALPVDAAGSFGIKEGEPRLSHRSAYSSLLSSFFDPEQNILLMDEDEPERAAHRKQWDDIMEAAINTLFETEPEQPSKSSDGLPIRMQNCWAKKNLRDLIRRHITKWTDYPDKTLDLYESMKDLSQDIVLDIFLGLDPQSEENNHRTISSLSTQALRGQFAAPVPLRFGSYLTSQYSAGLDAQKRLDTLITQRITAGVCPYLQNQSARCRRDSPSQAGTLDLASHTSLFSSGLVVKAFASYLTSAMLQLYRPSEAGSSTLANKLATMESSQQQKLLASILTETERLCPPIIGVMRKVENHPLHYMDTRIPVGWDIWLYFPLINRSEKAYGKDGHVFKATRFVSSPDGSMPAPEPTTFGLGPKRCIGQSLIRRLADAVITEVLGLKEPSQSAPLAMSLIGDEGGIDASLRDFLGWNPEASAENRKWKALKQL